MALKEEKQLGAKDGISEETEFFIQKRPNDYLPSLNGNNPFPETVSNEVYARFKEILNALFDSDDSHDPEALPSYMLMMLEQALGKNIDKAFLLILRDFLIQINERGEDFSENEQTEFVTNFFKTLTSTIRSDFSTQPKEVSIFKSLQNLSDRERELAGRYSYFNILRNGKCSDLLLKNIDPDEVKLLPAPHEVDDTTEVPEVLSPNTLYIKKIIDVTENGEEVDSTLPVTWNGNDFYIRPIVKKDLSIEWITVLSYLEDEDKFYNFSPASVLRISDEGQKLLEIFLDKEEAPDAVINCSKEEAVSLFRDHQFHKNSIEAAKYYGLDFQPKSLQSIQETTEEVTPVEVVSALSFIRNKLKTPLGSCLTLSVSLIALISLLFVLKRYNNVSSVKPLKEFHSSNKPADDEPQTATSQPVYKIQKPHPDDNKQTSGPIIYEDRAPYTGNLIRNINSSKKLGLNLFFKNDIDRNAFVDNLYTFYFPGEIYEHTEGQADDLWIQIKDDPKKFKKYCDEYFK